MIRQALCAAALSIAAAGAAAAQQVADTSYAPPVSRPAYAPNSGPVVAIDEAHFNFHTVDGRYEPFAILLRRDGYRVTGFRTRFSADALEGVGVLVIANALNERNAEDWSLPTPSAFAPEEIEAVRAWIAAGGSLFLIADHMPFAGAAADLGRALGVTFENGYAQVGGGTPGRIGDIFEPPATLKESAVTRGRAKEERITKVITFTGSAFKPPKSARPVLVLGPGSVSRDPQTAGQITPETPRVPVDGWCQGAIMKMGKGRVAVFGEAAMFSAQLAGPNRLPMGMNAPEATQNHQLLLNILHWLSRVKGMPE